MKKVVFSIAFSFFSFLLIASPVQAQGICNQRCEINEDCGRGYRCYVGVCRAESCPASSTCSCGASTVTTPRPAATVTPRVTTSPTASPSASPTPRATARPTATPVASSSGVLTENPKTGAESWMIAGFSVALFLGGILLSGVDKVQKLPPQELFKQRSSKKIH